MSKSGEEKNEIFDSQAYSSTIIQGFMKSMKKEEKGMQEETTQKTIALVMRSSRLTADVLKKAIKMYLEHRKAGKKMREKINAQKGFDKPETAKGKGREEYL